VTAPANRWKLGLFVLAGCGATISGLTWLGMRELKRAYHTAYAYFDEALTGLEEGSPVKFRGVTIGVVEAIRVADDKKHLKVQASLFDDYLTDLGLDVSRLEGECPLPENLRAQVVMSWVTSTAFVQVDFFPDPPSGPQRLPFPVGANTLRTVPSTAKGLEDASREVLRELPAMAMSARELIELLRSDLQAARIPELARQLAAVLQSAERELENVRREATVATTTRAIGAVQEAAAELRQLAASVRTEVEHSRLPQTTDRVRGAADALGGLGGEVRAELVHLRSALAAIERLAAMLERDPAALLRGRGAAPTSPLEEVRR
jgi:ABC-type transporter Mla subunit MlaD